MPVELGLGMPFSAHPNYRMADSLRPREPVAIGPGWKSGSVWRSLAADSGYSHHTTIDRLSPDTIGLSVEYKRGGFGVSQRYTLTGDELAILSSVDAAVDSTCFVVPLLVSDGTTKSNCHVSEGDIGVRYLGYNYSVLFDKRMSYEISPAVFANRNGIYKNLIIRSKGNRIDVRLKLHQEPPAWIRINQLGYAPDGLKTAVLAAKDAIGAKEFEVIDANSHQTVYKAALGRSFGSYGPFADTRRLDFPAVRRPGRYFIRAGTVVSAEFLIGPGVYDGAADFCLRYLRQQRSGFNPFLKDSCHTHDGYTLYAPVKDSTHIDVVGGWHDASDYLQYSTTTANAVFHLLAAWRDFPGAFGDQKQANGLDGANKIPDVLDEAKWGLDWLLKMHPKPDWLFNQLGDDRDHRGMRIPKEDTNYYGRGLERPVYFCTGQPQVRGRFMNQTTGVASTAGKFAAAFALGNKELAAVDSAYARRLGEKARTALQLGLDKPGVCQTASVLSPYIYAEDNWTDDMELAAAALNQPDKAWDYARQEKITPWLGGDTARHYQWYPFINVGHYELAKIMKGVRRDSILAWYREGIDRVWQKAKTNAFYRHIPFIWCSNNLTVSFAIQCYWYRQLSGDRTYRPMEQACFDWIFGCNPWGTSMVYGLPSDGDTPSDPHSAFTHLKNYPIDGGLVDGPVYTSIYDHLIGIRLTHEDAYKEFQSGLAVYHDDYGDYSTNEPTMDGTASLVYLLAAQQAQADKRTVSHGAIVRGDSSRKNVALVFTADEFGEGLTTIAKALGKQKVKGSFFFTGRLYRNPAVKRVIRQLHDQGNYLGPHSDQHLLYADWTKRDSTLVSADSFRTDLQKSLSAMHTLGPDAPHYFIPPYEWWNDTVAAWSRSMGWQLVNFTPGIRTNADYTYPEMGRAYLPSDAIIKSVQQYEATRKGGLNGAIILIHAGTDPRRKDKLYDRLDETIRWLKKKATIVSLSPTCLHLKILYLTHEKACPPPHSSIRRGRPGHCAKA
ncbi:glycoside hydrolase family 9 protein [Puia sp. P3]|uniref:glycoside hydrolase family 9 protein n=1 Tax=Puia sp. P3 TaxID=3423952 RepID=UPI003D67F5B6